MLYSPLLLGSCALPPLTGTHIETLGAHRRKHSRREVFFFNVYSSEEMGYFAPKMY